LGRFCELKDETPFSWEVAERYDASKEPPLGRERSLSGKRRCLGQSVFVARMRLEVFEITLVYSDSLCH
jgi:hypothetical protein